MTATEVSLSCHPSLMFGSTARTVLTQSGGKEVGRNLKFQATRVCAVNCFSATHSRALHPSDSPPQRDGSSCPSRARKRAQKSMPASPTSRASEDEKTVFALVLCAVPRPFGGEGSVHTTSTGARGACFGTEPESSNPWFQGIGRVVLGF